MRASLVVFASSLGLFGCYSPLQGSAPDRAIAYYHDAHSTAGLSEGEGHAARKPAPSSLGIEDAVRLAKENSPRLAELTARAEAAKFAADAKDRSRNPELRISQVNGSEIANGKPVVRPSLRFFPTRPGEVGAEVAEARASETAARAALEAETRAVEADVRWLFEDVLLLDAEIAAVNAVAEARRALASRMKERLEAAVATAVDETLAELAAVEAEQDGAELAAKRAAALGRLLDAVGVDANASVKIVGEAKTTWPPGKLPSERALVEEALRHDARVAEVSAKMDAAGARISIEKGKRYPWLTFLDLGYEFGPKTTPGLGFTLQAGVDLPIFDTNRNGVRASEAALDAETRALAAEVERVIRDVREKLREAKAAEDLVTAYRAHAIPVAERAAEASKQALEGRGIDILRALVVDERRVLVELRLLRIQRRYRVAVAELRRVVGGHFPDEP